MIKRLLARLFGLRCHVCGGRHRPLGYIYGAPLFACPQARNDVLYVIQGGR